MLFIDDTLNDDIKKLAKSLGISEDTAAILMNSASPNVRIFVNRKYKNIRRDTSPVSNQILNKKGDDQYYATKQLVMDLFDVSNSSASKMMKLSNNLPKTASSPTSSSKGKPIQSNSSGVFFDAPLEEQINVDYVDKEGIPHSKQYDGILLDEVLSKYYIYQLEKDFYDSQSNQSQTNETKKLVADLKKRLKEQDSFRVTTQPNGKNTFKKFKGGLNSDNLVARLYNQMEAYDRLVDQYEELKQSIAVRKNVNPIDDTVSFERDMAYKEYKQWLDDHNKAEPDDNRLRNIAKQSKPNQN